MIPKPKPKGEENVDSWLMSYADMITLLMCFFIIFVSVSEPKKDKLSEIADGMAGKFGSVEYETPLMGAIRSLRTVIEEKRLYKDVAIQARSNGLLLELSTRKFFKDGGAELDEATVPELDTLLEAMKQSDLTNYNIVIESHTDDVPPKSGLYRTNWELSSVRAAKLANFMAGENFLPSHLRAVGYGDTRPEVPNLDAEGNPIVKNRDRNQRIVIRLEQRVE